MPKFSADEVEIYYEVTGEGFPLVWSHEFGGSYESWETQVRYFTRRNRARLSLELVRSRANTSPGGGWPRGHSKSLSDDLFRLLVSIGGRHVQESDSPIRSRRYRGHRFLPARGRISVSVS